MPCSARRRARIFPRGTASRAPKATRISPLVLGPPAPSPPGCSWPSTAPARGRSRAVISMLRKFGHQIPSLQGLERAEVGTVVLTNVDLPDLTDIIKDSDSKPRARRTGPLCATMRGSRGAALMERFPKENLSAFLNFLRAKYEAYTRAQTVFSRPYYAMIDPCDVCQLRCPTCPTGIENEGRRSGNRLDTTYRTDRSTMKPE